jgi:uncharacterized protein YeaC (DUF1315 family)
MNTQLVNSIVQIVENLSPEERQLVKQKLSRSVDLEQDADGTELTLADRQAFLQKSLTERRFILSKQAEEMLEHYQSSNEWRELMAGDIIDG